MAISTGSSGSSKVNADINVTPMIDVMLVLLIIFMIVTPLIADGDTGYNGQTLGGYATYTFDVTKDVSFDATLAAGHQFISGGGAGPGGGAGTYGTLEVTTSF